MKANELHYFWSLFW